MLLSVIDLERDSQISRHTWRAWNRQKRLPVIRAGRRVRISEDDYRRFLTVPSAGPRERQAVNCR